MSKGQLFSPLYTLVFVILILSTLLAYETIIKEWGEHALLENEARGLNTFLELMKEFTKAEEVYNTSTRVNLTINSSSVQISKEEYGIVFNNTHSIQSVELRNVQELRVVKSDEEWFIE